MFQIRRINTEGQDIGGTNGIDNAQKVLVHLQRDYLSSIERLQEGEKIELSVWPPAPDEELPEQLALWKKMCLSLYDSMGKIEVYRFLAQGNLNDGNKSEVLKWLAVQEEKYKEAREAFSRFLRPQKDAE